MSWRARIDAILEQLGSSPLWWGGLVALLYLANAICLAQTPTNGDVAWYLYAIRRINEGAALYRDIHDINLPIVYLAHLPFGWLAALTGLPIQFYLYLALWLSLAAFLVWLWRLPGLDFMTRAVAVFGTACAALTVNKFHTGQRDTVCGLLFAGLLAAVYTRIEMPEKASDWRLWLAVIAASVSIAFKPYLLAPWLVLVIYLAFRIGVKETLRTKEFWLPPVISVVSWIVTVAGFPDYLKMASFATRYYSYLNGEAWLYFPLVFPVTTAVVALRRKMPADSRMRTLVQLAAWAALGFALDSIAQRKGSGYHMGPSFFWGAVTFGLLHAQRLETDTGGLTPKMWNRRAGLIVTAIGFTIYSIDGGIAPPPTARTVVDRYLVDHCKGETVLALAVNPWVAFPAILEAGATNARADASLWALPGMYRDQVMAAENDEDRKTPAKYHTRAQMSADESRYFDEVVGLVASRKPDVIVVEIKDKKWGFNNVDFDFVAYFSSDERFRAGLAGYRQGPSDKTRTIYQRVSQAVASAGPAISH